MTILAQAAAPTPEVAWSTFAPELLLGGTVMVLLLLTVADRARIAVALPVGAALAAGGAYLLATSDASPLLGGSLLGLGILLVALVVGLGGVPRLINTWVAGAGVFGALLLTLWQVRDVLQVGDAQQAVVAMQGAVALDGIAVFTRLTVYVTTLLVLPMSYGYLRDRHLGRAEFEPLLLLSATGMALLGAASDAITLFIALEILSIALYILAGIARRDRRSQEAAIKYFVNGAVASAVLLYGLALLYVATGSLSLPGIGAAVGLASTPLEITVVGLALVTVGIGFKVAMVPFHLWTPDVYQGAPTNVTAFMAAGTKAAAFAVLLRLYLVTFGLLDDLWVPVLAWLAAATMLYGAFAAIVQRDVKRILAYSAIAHAGYALIGVVARGDQGVSSTLWYLLTYAVSTLAAFGVVIAMERQRGGEVTLLDLRGLGRTSPILAGILSIALLSLAGIPPTAGFAGKLLVFQAGIGAGYVPLVVVGVATSVVAAFFYLRIMGAMFLEEPREGATEPDVSLALQIGVSLSAAAVVFLGIQPADVLELVRSTATIAQ